MPTGPQGQKRPVSPVSSAVMVGRIATGEITETPTVAPLRELRPAAAEASPESR